jgi:hypothetical protein
MTRLLITLFLTACALCSHSAHAARLALVIGNDSYKSVGELKNARADADAISASLRKAGYQVSTLKDQNLSQFKDGIRLFRAKVQAHDELVFFFAGHGVQIGGDNYLLPVDVRAVSEAQIKDDALTLSKILEDLRENKPALTLAIIDACRDNPFKKSGRALGGRGLTGVAGATGQLVMYSAGEGQQALDNLGAGDTASNSLFTRVFIEEMKKTGVSVDEVLRNVRAEVNTLAKSVNHEQVPALYDQVIGKFYFYPGKAAPDNKANEAKNFELEKAYWESIKDSANPRDYLAYQDKWPQGAYLLAAQKKSGVWQTTKTGCKGFLRAPAAPNPAEKYDWSGSCLEGYVHGKGTMLVELKGERIQTQSGTYSKGIEEGVWKYESLNPQSLVQSAERRYANGVPAGRVKDVFKNGQIYEGEFDHKNNRYNGYGVLSYPNGSRYEGNLSDGYREGAGVMYLKDGSQIKSNWKANDISGVAQYADANGNTYTGPFKGELPDGAGEIVMKDGQKIKVLMQAGKLVKRY